MIQEIASEGKLIALLIDNGDIGNGTHPITNESWPLQMLMMKRSSGHIFAKHTHTVIDRTTTSLQEAVVVTKGLLRITVCKRDGTEIGVWDVSAGQCLFLVDGGYTLETVGETAFYEFKNGPYAEDKVLL